MSSYYGAVTNPEGEIVLTGKRKTEESAIERAVKLAKELGGTRPVAIEANSAKEAREKAEADEVTEAAALEAELGDPDKPRTERKPRKAFDPEAVRFVIADEFLVSKSRIVHATSDCSSVKRATVGLENVDADVLTGRLTEEDSKWTGTDLQDPAFIAAHACRYCAVQAKELASAETA